MGIEEDRIEDYWRDRAECPLGSKQLFDKYDNGIVPEGQVVTLKIDRRSAQQRNPFNCLVCAATGVGKDRLIKNIIKAYHKAGFKILHFEPKGIEMFNARKMGSGSKLHHKDKNDSLPVVGYCPNYIRAYLKKYYPELIRKIKFYSHDMEKLNYLEIWQSFGVPVKISSMVVKLIEQGITDYKLILQKLKGAGLHRMTEQAVVTAFDSLEATNFFGARNSLQLKESWDRGEVVNIMYLSRGGAMMNTDIGLILDLVKDVSMEENRQGMKNVSKKLIIFNDAFYYAGMKATMSTKYTGGTNLAILNIQNCQNNFRSWGVDTMFVVQSPDSNAVYPALIDGCTTKLVSYVENPTALQNKLPFHAYRLLMGGGRPGEESLFVNEEKYEYEWIKVLGKTRCERFFKFDCSLGHI